MDSRVSVIERSENSLGYARVKKQLRTSATSMTVFRYVIASTLRRADLVFSSDLYGSETHAADVNDRTARDFHDVEREKRRNGVSAR